MSDKTGGPKKHFGQHFLVNAGVIQKIADQVQLQFNKEKDESFVMEIGPGQGALTEELLNRGLRVVAVEIDTDMVTLLSEKFSQALRKGDFKLIHKDALKLDEVDWKSSRVICGNLPYNVGSAIVTRALKEWKSLKYFCFMLQKEVVEKFIATEGSDYGPASVRMAWMAEVQGHFWVKPGSFSPPPKVDSGVFWYTRLSDEKVPTQLEERMRILDSMFSKRRKMVRVSEPRLKESAWSTLRPEDVSSAEFIKLTDLLLNPPTPQ